MKAWVRGALNSAMHAAAKLAIIILGAFTVGAHLDAKTLIYAASVGWLYGTAKWVYENPFPDDSSTPPTIDARNLPKP